jgi:hypothetical protein
MLMRSASFDNKENFAPPKSMGTARSDRTPLSTIKYHRYSSTDEYEYETYTTGRDDAEFRLPGPSTVDGHFEWEVEAIMAVRAGANDPEFLVKWFGWPSNSCTWEPLCNLTHCGDALAAFFDLVERQQAQLSSVGA